MDIVEHNKQLLKIIREQLWMASTLYQNNFCDYESETYTPDSWNRFVQNHFVDLGLSLSREIEKLEGASEEELQKSYPFLDYKKQEREEDMPF